MVLVKRYRCISTDLSAMRGEHKTGMKTNRIDSRCGQEYVVAFRVYVQANGGICVVMSNQKMEVTPDEIHALLCGALDFARVFGALSEQAYQPDLAVLSMSDGMNGNSTM
jgi:hypothetical protein